MKTTRSTNYFRQSLSFALLIVFIFCTTSSITSAPASFSKIKTFQKEAKSGSDSESFMFEELDEDADDVVDTPVLDLFQPLNVVLFTSQYVQTEEAHPITEAFPLHAPLFLSIRILRI